MFSPRFKTVGLAASAMLLMGQAVPAVADRDTELHLAPAAARGNAPAEAMLSPPPDAEKVHEAPGFVQIRNPAFPDLSRPPAPVVDPGPKYDVDSVAPYFASGVLAEAKAAFDKGQYAAARKKLQDAGDEPPVRYLRALAAVRSEDHANAAKEMAALADDYPAMRDRCLTHAGVAFAALGDHGQAAALLEKVPADSRMYADARIALFRALRGMGDQKAAAAALEPLANLPAPSWGRDMGAEALLELADLAKKSKDKAAETDALQRLWAQHPLSPQARHAEARLDLAKLPLERTLERAEALVDAHRNRDGIEMLEPLAKKLQLPDPLACRAHFTLGKSYRKERLHRDAIRSLAPVSQKCEDRELLPRVLYVLASSRSIVDLAHGPGVYETLAREFPDHSFADDALYFAADVYLTNGDAVNALARLAELSDRYPQGDFAAEALFKSFWMRRQRGEREQALAVLDQIEQTFADAPETYELERARYWRARMEESAGNKDAAAQLLARLAIDHPATYYGLIARKRLTRLDEERAREVARQLRFPASGSSWPLHAGALAKDPHFLAGVELLRLGFPEAVSSELLAADRTRLPPESIRLLVQLLSKAGDQRAAHAVARLSLRGDLSGRITAETRPIWEIAYPLAFRDLVKRHCAKAGIDPDLLQALMREESALDPKALSWAGALGLTQLMPSTAKAVARRLKIPNVTPRRLLEPELNLQIGSAYLGELVKRFDGTEEYALAGYNAGGGAVVRWRRDRPSLELDEWVEEIPIAETRGYVKRVLRSYNTYQLLYPGPERVSQAARR